MMASLCQFWTERSARERAMLGVMVMLLMATLTWFAAIVPLRAALAGARERLDRVTSTSGRVAAQVAALQRVAGVAITPPPRPLADAIASSAREAGFTPTRADANGDDRVVIAIAAAKSTALFGWLGALSARGIVVEQIALRPNSDATLSVEAMLVARRP
jgi:general secretion pathway protein M